MEKRQLLQNRLFLALFIFNILNEIIAERSPRFMKKRNFDNLKRSNETIAERSTRLENMRKFDTSETSNETIAERSTRLEKKRNLLFKKLLNVQICQLPICH